MGAQTRFGQNKINELLPLSLTSLFRFPDCLISRNISQEIRCIVAFSDEIRDQAQYEGLNEVQAKQNQKSLLFCYLLSSHELLSIYLVGSN